jgi:hypothetical protein
MPRPPAEPTLDGETIVERGAGLGTELPAVGHGLLAGSVAERVRAARCRSDDPRAIPAVARQSGMAQQAAD